ncbi:type II toxin-antitoxin system HicB family antitoxin [Ramlibacter sp. AW1]|uniref:Type II toxin-antitoxin system HicB family antitoxin n=1 Tax=Ramlibacter aurantiacus TaxID=2801330 RepID=A0A937D1Q5_9BURK|nr:type II toxin-antitoxin system HicB family antitoxin [Ramlibacter aurantiacus]MBL0419015.1 type II toxin-antitoxin system HicB family antitoxin [Ramlibacter aurantiacus]
MNLMRYLGFDGTAEIDLDRGTCFGKLLFIDDLVTYEASDPRALKAEFHAAVDDYLETCRQLGRPPKKPHSGLFNVRTTPEKHRDLLLCAAERGISLNAVVNEAIAQFLSAKCSDGIPTPSCTVAVNLVDTFVPSTDPRNFVTVSPSGDTVTPTLFIEAFGGRQKEAPANPH